MVRIRFELGAPEHGWTTVRLELDGRRIEFSASAVPTDPVGDLVDALRSALLGRSARVRCALEPGSVTFDFAPCAEGLCLVVSSVDHAGRIDETTAMECRSSAAVVALPLWRGLRRFASRAPAPPHWPAADSTAMDALTALVQRLRAI